MKEQSLTLQIPSSLLNWIEGVRGEKDRSAYVLQVLQEKMDQSARQTDNRREWLAQGREQYTAAICSETLELNEDFPVHEE